MPDTMQSAVFERRAAFRGVFDGMHTYLSDQAQERRVLLERTAAEHGDSGQLCRRVQSFAIPASCAKRWEAIIRRRLTVALKRRLVVGAVCLPRDEEPRILQEVHVKCRQLYEQALTAVQTLRLLQRCNICSLQQGVRHVEPLGADHGKASLIQCHAWSGTLVKP